MKTCFKCQRELPLSDFYKHKMMADGHLGKCKGCAKNDATEHRNNNIEKIRKYDRDRGNRKTPGYLRELREKFPRQYKAQYLSTNAVRDGRMKQEPCEVCGEKAHGHHDDYDYPLTVRWLCPAHHHQWHRDNGEGKNRN
jgi:hypothetical protein